MTVTKAKAQESTVQTSSIHAEGEAGSVEGSGVFRKMTKSFGSAKDALAKLAKNEWSV